jgi:hypothetical protein
MRKKAVKERHLPRPPKMDRKVCAPPLQWLFLGLLVLVPLLAVFGIFGPRQATVESAGTGIELRARYPSLLRHKLIEPFSLEVRNTLSTQLPRVIVRLDRGYVEHFSEVTFTPEPERVTEQSYEIVLQDVQPGETRRIAGQVQGERYGRRRGAVAAIRDDGVSSSSTRAEGGARVELSTFVFP